MAVTYTQAQIAEAEASLIEAMQKRAGAKTIAFADQSMTFESWDEAYAFIAHMKRNAVDRPRVRYAVVNKGV